jgi:hypothetical protein
MTEQKKALSSGNDGEVRTPDKTIGEVKFARGRDDNPKDSAAKNSGSQDSGGPSRRTAAKIDARKSQNEGPAAYAPHDEGEKKGSK